MYKCLYKALCFYFLIVKMSLALSLQILFLALVSSCFSVSEFTAHEML